MNVCLIAEINWINRNLHLYESAWHAKAVIANITKRYDVAEVARKLALTEKELNETNDTLDEVTSLITAYNETRNTRDQLELLEWQR